MIGRVRRGLRTARGNVSTTTGVFGGRLTGCPHFRQYCASSGSVAPHLAHPSRTLATGGVVLLDDINTALRAQERIANIRKIFGANSAGGARLSKAEMPADISTALGNSNMFGNARFYRAGSVRNPRSASVPSASTARIMAAHRIPICRSDHGRSSGRPVYWAL